MPDHTQTPNRRNHEFYQIMQHKIAHLLDGGDPKQFRRNEDRLRAALFLSKLYKQAKTDLSLLEIKARCGAAINGSEDFRIHRWMLQTSETKITPELIKRYAKRKEPARKVRNYLQLVAVLAKMNGDNPLLLQMEFITTTGLNARPIPEDLLNDISEVQPEHKLANLLRGHAAYIAERFDLGSLFLRAERLQAGWDMENGPVAIGLGSWHGEPRFDSQLPANYALWYESAIPPYPAIKIARIPYGNINSTFSVVPVKDDGTTIDENRDPLILCGSAIAYWDLHLAIAPDGKFSIGSYFIRSTSVDIQLPIDGLQTFTLRDAPHDLSSFFLDYKSGNLINHNGLWQVHFTPEATEHINVDLEKNSTSWDANYRPVRKKDQLDETPPGDTVPNARITPVNARSISDWLIEDLSLPTELGVTETLNYLSQPSELNPSTWCQGDTIARRLETELHTDVIDERFKSWIDQYNRSLDDLEKHWFDSAHKSESELRLRWLDAQLNQPSAPEGGNR